jgi:ketosteroid isomerase-like protein
MNSNAKAVLQRYLDALVAGDLDTIEDSFAPDATWWLHGTLPLSGTKRGRAEILEFLLGAGSLYQPGTQEFEFGDITADGERAVLEWRVRAIASATGKPYDNSYAGVFVVRDGRIVEVREYLDSLYAAEVLYAAVAAA